MRRRAFIASIAASLAAPSLGAAQPAGRVYRIGSLSRGGREAAAPYNDAGPELGGKLLQLLKDGVPGVMRVAVLHEASPQPGYAAYAAVMETASKSLGLSLHWVEVRGPSDLDRAFAAIRRERADAVVLAVQAMAITHARLIADFAKRSRLATIARTREFVEAGGLIAYSTDIIDLYRRAAVYIDKIFRGAKPGDLPVEQPAKFELAVNLNTADALGLTIPQALVMRADRTLGR